MVELGTAIMKNLREFIIAIVKAITTILKEIYKGV